MSSARWSQLRTFEHQDRPNGEAQQVVSCFSWCSKDEGGKGGGGAVYTLEWSGTHCIVLANMLISTRETESTCTLGPGAVRFGLL